MLLYSFNTARFSCAKVPLSDDLTGIVGNYIGEECQRMAWERIRSSLFYRYIPLKTSYAA